MIFLLLLIPVGLGAAYAFYRVGALAGLPLLLIGLLLLWKGGRQVMGHAKKSLLSLSAVLLVALVTGGCASSPGGIAPITQLKEEARLAAFSNLALEVSSPDDVPMTSTDRERLSNLIVTMIKTEAPGRFKEINPTTPNPSTLHVALTVTKYDKGNAFARFMLAGLGQIHIDGEVVLEDRERGEALGKYEVTKTFAWGGFYGGATRIEDVEEGFAGAIVALLLGTEAGRGGEQTADKGRPVQPTPAPPAATAARREPPPTAATALEEQLQRLSDLKTQGKITEDEHALLRKRVIETFPLTQPVAAQPRQETPPKAPQIRAAAPAPAPPAASLPAGAVELIGTWRGTALPRFFQMTVTHSEPVTLRLSEDQGQLRWDLTRVQQAGSVFGDRRAFYTGEVRASGSVEVAGGDLTLSGRYDTGPLRGTPITYRLSRSANVLSGTGMGTDNLVYTLSVTRDGK
ncbi:MAG: DUF4410 domain-containing protein [Candidatus Rokubacteria bacterium]|nr:DUF4410 domain-containing protein [Candidatus Rokubacteria bacterium]